MKKLSNQELTKEFHNMIKDVYPDLSLQDIRDIVYNPWRDARKAMESGDLPEIQFKYFGKFSVRMRKAEINLKGLKGVFDKGLIDHSVYFKKKKMLENYLTKELKKRKPNGEGKIKC